MPQACTTAQKRRTPPTGSDRLAALRLRLVGLARRGAADQSGSSAIQYALIAAGIGAAVAATVYSVGITTATLVPTFSNLY
jgi:Flp pilus assembly pilin Flp